MRKTRVRQLKKELIELLGRTPTKSEFRDYKKCYVNKHRTFEAF